MQVDRLVRVGIIAAVFAMLVPNEKPAWAETSSAPDVVVFTEPTMMPAIVEIGRAYRARTGHPVRVFAAPSTMLLREIPHTRDDVMILQGEANAKDAISRKIAAPAPLIALGRNHLVVARRGTGPSRAVADLGTPGPIAIVDAPVPDQLGALSHAAIDVAKWPGADARVIGVARGADATFLLASGEAAYAIVYRTDIAADPSLSIAAALPDPSSPIDYFALMSAQAASPNTHEFLAYLDSTDGHAELRKAGLAEAAP